MEMHDSQRHLAKVGDPARAAHDGTRRGIVDSEAAFLEFPRQGTVVLDRSAHLGVKASDDRVAIMSENRTRNGPFGRLLDSLRRGGQGSVYRLCSNGRSETSSRIRLRRRHLPRRKRAMKKVRRSKGHCPMIHNISSAIRRPVAQEGWTHSRRWSTRPGKMQRSARRGDSTAAQVVAPCERSRHASLHLRHHGQPEGEMLPHGNIASNVVAPPVR